MPLLFNYKAAVPKRILFQLQIICSFCILQPTPGHKNFVFFLAYIL